MHERLDPLAPLAIDVGELDPHPRGIVDFVLPPATRVTRPMRSKGKVVPGSWKISLTVVPTGNGVRVLMKIPPWLMLVAQSLRNLPTVRYATGSSCWRRRDRRPSRCAEIISSNLEGESLGTIGTAAHARA